VSERKNCGQLESAALEGVPRVDVDSLSKMPGSRLQGSASGARVSSLAHSQPSSSSSGGGRPPRPKHAPISFIMMAGWRE
jgi:hypothetical protein